MEKAVSSTTFLASPKFLEPVMSLIQTVIESDSNLENKLKAAYIQEARDLLIKLVHRTDLDSSLDKISVEVARSEFGVRLEIINRGTPINFKRVSVLDGKFF
ncbi:MAG: hypothetical protein K2X47_03285, partial [Bdellovibrionales bacterium]|nr:hypothetical protein [Bdellovibrionales bacterium]